MSWLFIYTKSARRRFELFDGVEKSRKALQPKPRPNTLYRDSLVGSHATPDLTPLRFVYLIRHFLLQVGRQALSFFLSSILLKYDIEDVVAPQLAERYYNYIFIDSHSLIWFVIYIYRENAPFLFFHERHAASFFVIFRPRHHFFSLIYILHAESIYGFLFLSLLSL